MIPNVVNLNFFTSKLFVVIFLLLLCKFLLSFTEELTWHTIYSIGKLELNTTDQYFRKYVFGLEVKIEIIITFLIAWFSDSYLGKHNVLLTATVCGALSTIFFLLVFVAKQKLKYVCFYIGFAFLALQFPVLRVTLPALLQDQVTLPRDRKIFRMTMLAYLWVLDFSEAIVRSITRFAAQTLSTGLFINLAIFIITFIGLMMMKKYLRVKYYFQVVEKILGCWYEALVLKYYSNTIQHSLARNINWIEKVEKYPEDVKQAALQLYILIRTMMFLIIYLTTSYIVKKKISFLVGWFSNDNRLFINVSAHTYINIFCLGFFLLIDFFLVPFLQRIFNVCKSDLGQMFLSFIFLLVSLSFVIYFQFMLEKTVPIMPTKGNGQIKIYNGLNSEVELRSKWIRETVRPLSKQDLFFILVNENINRNITVISRNFTINVSIEARDGVSVSYIICQNGMLRIEGIDEIKNSVKYNESFLTVISCYTNDTFAMMEISNSTGFVKRESVPIAKKRKFFGPISPEKVKIRVRNKTESLNLRLSPGGYYVLMISQTFIPTIFVVAERTTIDAGYLFFPVVFTSLEQANFRLSLFRFMGYETPEIVRSFTFCTYYSMASLSSFIADDLLFGLDLGSTLNGHTLIIVLMFLLTNCILYIYTLIHYSPYNWP